MAEGGRKRGQQGPRQYRQSQSDFAYTNPYPWMSSIEAMVHLALEDHRVPFSWRFFDAEAPTFTQLLVNDGYQPEFTLREYKTVIIVQGGFFGTLPGVLDKVALAKVTLEEDGWKVVILWDSDIRTVGAWELLIKELPTLGSITGPVRANPYPVQDLMKRRSHTPHREINPTLSSEPSKSKARTEDGKRKRRVRRGHRGGGDSGRVRLGVTGAVSGRTKVI